MLSRLVTSILVAAALAVPLRLEAKDNPDLEPIGDGDARPAGFEGDTNAPEDYGTGYLSWGTAGGATLGAGNGVRAGLNGGSHLNTGYLVGPEAYFILGIDRDFDVLLGGRLSFWWFGLQPGVRIRYRVMEKDAFHLAIDAGAYVGFWLVPVFTGGFGTSVNGVGFGQLDPTVMGSYFIKDNMEIYFGLGMPVTLMGGGNGFAVSVDIQFKGGFAYTFKKINLGVYAQMFIGPTILAGDFGGSPFVYAHGGAQGGINYRF